MKVKKIEFRVLAMQVLLLAGFSLMQGCTTGDAPVRWLNWPYSTPKDEPVVLPVVPDTTPAGSLPAGDNLPSVARAPAQIHRVQKGETLSSIASSYGTSWKKLAENNGMSNPNQLKIGQELRIPESTGFGAPAPAAKRAPSTSSRPALKSIKQGSSYTIQKGDALSTIAKRSGLSVSEIKLANGLQNDSIVAGKKLTIPKKGEMKAAATAKSETPAVAKSSAAASPSLPAVAPMVDAAPAASAAVTTLAATSATQTVSIAAVPATQTTAPAAAPVASAASAPVYEHVLYPGETLDDVARQYGSSQQAIMKLNNITDPASIKPGAKLLVPIPE